MNKKPFIIGGIVLATIAFIVAGSYGFLYASSPSHIRHPEIEHYHFRTQIIVDGQPVDFSSDEFQQDYKKGVCSSGISETPVDFHDNMDQMTHVHWDGMTGGEFLKYFGWNFIGGSDNKLGRRYDGGFMHMQTVEYYGDLLPEIPEDTNFWVYVGDQNNFEQKSWDDFLNQDLEEFFGKKSNLSQDEQASLIERLFFPKAYAHGGVMDDHDEDSDKTEEELQQINNLIGNVVIFVQKDEPTNDQVQERFSNLVPLSESTCGG